jgi:excisionase family DNA binding protein
MSTLTETDPLHSTPDFLRRSMSPREFARRVGVSPTTVHKWLEEGLPSGLIGARRLIHIDTADDWLKAKIGIRTNTANCKE